MERFSLKVYLGICLLMLKKKLKQSKLQEEIILKPQYSYEDVRGQINYHVLTEPVNWTGIITTKKGSIRGNHFHPKQEQKLLLISGKCICVYKDLKVQNSPIQHHLMEAGDLVVTQANVAHAVIYLEDCIQINLVKGERISDNYGKHTKKYLLVKPEDFDSYALLY